MGCIQHVIWDWNGTLLDDVDITVQATIDWMASKGRHGVTKELVKQHSSRDYADFFAALLGRRPTDAEIKEARAYYQKIYAPARHTLPLAPDAKLALDEVDKAGMSQSLLSMAPHAELTELVDLHGLKRQFLRVDGDRTASMHSKVENLRNHLEALMLEPETVAMIGDALDDYEVSAQTGIQPILVDTGMYSTERLEQTGAPVARSLTEAVLRLT